jgi:glyceraldehyde 3-phosphate dehydrogenase
MCSCETLKKESELRTKKRNMIKIGINGFGRIGRLACRIISKMEGIEVVSINDLAEPDYMAYQLKYDSTHGEFEGSISHDSKQLIINEKLIEVQQQKDPKLLSWEGIDVVLECTGLFLTTEDSKNHILAGAKRVLLSAPAKDDTPTFVMGVNHEEFKPEMQVISNASCTTNCLAPLAKVLNDEFTIIEGLMSTVHAITATQKTVDGASSKDWRGGRAAQVNIIPSSTGAAKAVGLVIPELKGKLTGMSFRVPLTDVSVVDLTVRFEKQAKYDDIIAALTKASKGRYKGVIAVSHEQLVSQDIVGNSNTCIVDVNAGIALNDHFVKMVAWYDNEWGYATKLVEMAMYIAKKKFPRNKN